MTYIRDDRIDLSVHLLLALLGLGAVGSWLHLRPWEGLRHAPLPLVIGTCGLCLAYVVWFAVLYCWWRMPKTDPAQAVARAARCRRSAYVALPPAWALVLGCTLLLVYQHGEKHAVFNAELFGATFLATGAAVTAALMHKLAALMYADAGKDRPTASPSPSGRGAG